MMLSLLQNQLKHRSSKFWTFSRVLVCAAESFVEEPLDYSILVFWGIPWHSVDPHYPGVGLCVLVAHTTASRGWCCTRGRLNEEGSSSWSMMVSPGWVSLLDLTYS
jgi:hypothetical protein